MCVCRCVCASVHVCVWRVRVWCVWSVYGVWSVMQQRDCKNWCPRNKKNIEASRKHKCTTHATPHYPPHKSLWFPPPPFCFVTASPPLFPRVCWGSKHVPTLQTRLFLQVAWLPHTLFRNYGIVRLQGVTPPTSIHPHILQWYAYVTPDKLIAYSVCLLVRFPALLLTSCEPGNEGFFPTFHTTRDGKVRKSSTLGMVP